MAKISDIHELIGRLSAIRAFSKDIHYNTTGCSSYGDHLLADRIADGIQDGLDKIKENILLGNKQKVLSSKEYHKIADKYIPDITDNSTTDNFKKLHKLIVDTQARINKISLDNSDKSLIDGIGEELKNKTGILNLRITDGDREQTK